jgi:stage II sporulation protein D
MSLQKWWGILLSSVLLCIHTSPQDDVTEQDDFNVYVLLDKKTCADDVLWTVEADDGFIICDVATEKPLEMVAGQALHFSVRRDALRLNGRKVAINALRIKPQRGYLRHGNDVYPGDVIIIVHEGTWYLVNGVDLEEYVCGVLRCESYPHWELEANKSQAIAQRSYVLAKITKTRGRKKIGKGFMYDIGKTNIHQTYRGLCTCEKTRRAVEETRGKVLVFKGNPVEAMYDICCGGIIPAHMDGVDFVGSPYLARAYACTFCNTSKLHSWKVSYTISEFEQLVKQLDARVGSIRLVQVTKTDKAGMVIELLIRTGKKTIKLSGKQVYSLCKSIRSFYYTATIEEGKVIFHGKGYGHHLGLCQYGALHMARQGEGSDAILSFYFPNTDILRLKILKNR